MTISPINLIDQSTPQAVRILQLFEHLELYSEGEPAQHTLFVLERAPLSIAPGAPSDRLLIIDPPTDTLSKFRLEGAITSLFTGEACASGLPQMDTAAGGVAHVRMGEHFLDIYSQQYSNVIYFPALAILCGGSFGSDASLPTIATGSDGSDELMTLRLLAQLVKRRLRLYIPRVGSLIEDPAQAMSRLADDVNYFLTLQRVLPGIAQRSDELAMIKDLTDSLLPAYRRSESHRAIHDLNVQRLLKTSKA